MSDNKVKKNCKYFNIPQVCKQSDNNCYGCEISRCEIAEKDVIRLRKQIDDLEKENTKLKVELAEMVTRPMEVADNETN